VGTPPSYAQAVDLIRSSGFFLRLARKTQVYTPRDNPHTRMRMTHTIDVLSFAQRLILRLPLPCIRDLDGALAHSGLRGPCASDSDGEADLAEQLHLVSAIALGHDLGHTPFGHAGEEALRSAAPDIGFKHNWQSVRILERVESSRCDYSMDRRLGMEVAWEVLDGIVNHTRRPDCSTQVTPLYLRDSPANQRRALESSGIAATAAGLAVAVADEVAQRVGDVSDGLRQEAIARDDLPEMPPAVRDVLERLRRWESATNAPTRQTHHVARKAEARNREYVLRVELQAALTGHYAEAVGDHWRRNTADVAETALQAQRASTATAYRTRFRQLLGDAADLDRRLETMVKERVHRHPDVIQANRLGGRVVGELAVACLREPSLALDWYFSRYEADRAAGSCEARYHLIDHVAALTDDHALSQHHKLLGTNFD